jgi:oxalate decarboxylase
MRNPFKSEPELEPTRGREGATIAGPRNLAREAQDPFTLRPPETDHGPLPNLKWSFADSHVRIEEGGWTRETTIRELPIAKDLAGVNMRLRAGKVRELHWHKEAEWAYMLKGSARITAIDENGRTFADDVAEGDLWYFPSGIPHSIQGLDSEIDGCEFLLVFDDGNFSEETTFLLTDWLAHTPKDIIAKNFRATQAQVSELPSKELYISPAPKPGELAADKISGAGPVPNTFSHQLRKQAPQRLEGGTLRIVDTTTFPASKTVAAALVELEPGALRELHWHPTADEWQYYIEGEGRMTVFAGEQRARTFDYRAGDVGYVPFAMGHYVENTGSSALRFLEIFKSDRYADLSLNQWLALTPPALVEAHLKLDRTVLSALPAVKTPIVKP